MSYWQVFRNDYSIKKSRFGEPSYLRCDECGRIVKNNQIRCLVGQWTTPDPGSNKEVWIHHGKNICYECYPKIKRPYGKNLYY